jgi:hypothetical protein
MAEVEFPAMLYRPGTQEEPWGIPSDLLTVQSEDEWSAALADGWFKVPTSLEGATKPEPKAKPAPVVAAVVEEPEA